METSSVEKQIEKLKNIKKQLKKIIGKMDKILTIYDVLIYKWTLKFYYRICSILYETKN